MGREEDGGGSRAQGPPPALPPQLSPSLGPHPPVHPASPRTQGASERVLRRGLPPSGALAWSPRGHAHRQPVSSKLGPTGSASSSAWLWCQTSLPWGSTRRVLFYVPDTPTSTRSRLCLTDSQARAGRSPRARMHTSIWQRREED